MQHCCRLIYDLINCPIEYRLSSTFFFMKPILIRLSALLIGLLYACTTPPTEDDATLQEAARVHTEAMRIEAEVEARFVRADSLRQLAALAEPDTGRIRQRERLLQAFDQTRSAFRSWQQEIVEVPGAGEHEHHDHGHGHSHDHAATPLPEVSAEQMLEIQQEMKRTIEMIQEELNRHMADAERITSS
jgi:hypothetical protein